MKDKIRKCIGCQKNFERAQLFRILKDYQSGKIILNPINKDFGRSVYLCKNSECVEKAFKKGRIAGLLKVKNIENLKELLQRNLIN